MKKRIISLFIASVIVLGSLAGCGKNQSDSNSDNSSKGTDTPLVVGYADFSEKFSPFFNESGYDREAMDLTQEYLVHVDRSGTVVMNGTKGETISYEGEDYEYTSLSDVTITEKDDKTVYNFKLREDVKFSDGKPLTADDVIFSLYVLLDPSYDGFETMNTMPITGYQAYKEQKAPNIEGIKKIGDYEVEVTTDGFDAVSINKFIVPIAPLHYYADAKTYDYDNNKFGFPMGDLSIVKEKTTTPMGAGPYKFVKYKNKTIYYEANNDYFKGAPKTKNLQLKESDINDLIPGIEQGTIDLSSEVNASKQAFEQIGKLNGNGDLDGKKMITNRAEFRGYGYMGINASTVNVGGDPSSQQSKDLRKALATVLAAYRDISIDSYFGDAASVVNYPISHTSWASPQKSDQGYRVAYSTDVDGNPIYTDDMKEEDKYAKALEAALGYFERAGYTVADGKLTDAPEGAKLNYEIIIPADGKGDHPSFAILADAKEAFEQIGFTLEINDPTDGNVLWDKLNAGTQELWCASWQADYDPDMHQLYHSESPSSNYYHINDPALDAGIMDARADADQNYRKTVYKDCFDVILDWAVEVPVYQRQMCTVYSPERVNADSVTSGITANYKWLREVENIEMK